MGRYQSQKTGNTATRRVSQKEANTSPAVGQTTVHPQHTASVVISNEFKNLATKERVQFHDADVHVEISPATVA